MGDIYLYAVAFIPKLWPLVSAGGLLGFEEFAERYWLWASRWLKRIPEKRRRHIKVATLFFATILSGFLAWSDEHKARLEAERAKFTSFERPNDLSSTIDRASKDTAADRPLRGLSNAQLRDSAIDFAAKMRKFEANAEDENIKNRSPGFSAQDTPEQRQAKWDVMVRRTEQRGEYERLAFSNTYLGHARELRDEITNRLQQIGILPPYVELSPIEQTGPIVLDTGSIAGAYPIASAANYIEALARRLPQP